MISKQTLPLVSVIIPFYNAETYLEETIKSVVNQSYANWELILADDGSSDGSTSIAKEYANKHSNKIIYVEHEGHVNKTAPPTRNLGIANARGELIAFLDADDLWLPRYLEQQVKTLSANPQAAMVCEATRYWYSWNNPAVKDVDIQVGAAAGQLYQPPQLAKQLYPLGTGAAPCMCALIIKKSVLTAINGFEESFVGKYHLLEDQAFLIKIYLQDSVYVSSSCNNVYRQRPDSMMHSMLTQGFHNEAHLFFLRWLDSYLDEKRITDDSIYKLLKKAFRPYRYPLADRIAKSLSHRWKLLTKNLA